MTPSPVPAILVIQATPAPAATPQGNLWQQVWAENQKTILLGFITVVIASILVGVFLKQFATTLVNLGQPAVPLLVRPLRQRADRALAL